MGGTDKGPVPSGGGVAAGTSGTARINAAVVNDDGDDDDDDFEVEDQEELLVTAKVQGSGETLREKLQSLMNLRRLGVPSASPMPNTLGRSSSSHFGSAPPPRPGNVVRVLNRAAGFACVACDCSQLYAAAKKPSSGGPSVPSPAVTPTASSAETQSQRLSEDASLSPLAPPPPPPSGSLESAASASAFASPSFAFNTALVAPQPGNEAQLFVVSVDDTLAHRPTEFTFVPKCFLTQITTPAALAADGGGVAGSLTNHASTVTFTPEGASLPPGGAREPAAAPPTVTYVNNRDTCYLGLRPRIRSDDSHHDSPSASTNHATGLDLAFCGPRLKRDEHVWRLIPCDGTWFFLQLTGLPGYVAAVVGSSGSGPGSLAASPASLGSLGGSTGATVLTMEQFSGAPHQQFRFLIMDGAHAAYNVGGSRSGEAGMWGGMSTTPLSFGGDANSIGGGAELAMAMNEMLQHSPRPRGDHGGSVGSSNDVDSANATFDAVAAAAVGLARSPDGAGGGVDDMDGGGGSRAAQGAAMGTSSSRHGGGGFVSDEELAMQHIMRSLLRDCAHAHMAGYIAVETEERHEFERQFHPQRVAKERQDAIQQHVSRVVGSQWRSDRCAEIDESFARFLAVEAVEACVWFTLRHREQVDRLAAARYALLRQTAIVTTMERCRRDGLEDQAFQSALTWLEGWEATIRLEACQRGEYIGRQVLLREHVSDGYIATFSAWCVAYELSVTRCVLLPGVRWFADAALIWSRAEEDRRVWHRRSVDALEALGTRRLAAARTIQTWSRRRLRAAAGPCVLQGAGALVTPTATDDVRDLATHGLPALPPAYQILPRRPGSGGSRSSSRQGRHEAAPPSVSNRSLPSRLAVATAEAARAVTQRWSNKTDPEGLSAQVCQQIDEIADYFVAAAAAAQGTRSLIECEAKGPDLTPPLPPATLASLSFLFENDSAASRAQRRHRPIGSPSATPADLTPPDPRTSSDVRSPESSSKPRRPAPPSTLPSAIHPRMSKRDEISLSSVTAYHILKFAQLKAARSESSVHSE